MSAVADTPAIAEQPATLNTDLWPHQIEAFDKAKDQDGFLLAHQMGCGKSAVAIALLERDQAATVIVLCPKSVVGVWPDQLAQHSARNWAVWHGQVTGARGPKTNPSVAERAAALITAYADAIKLRRPFCAVVNYEAAHVGQMAAALRGLPATVLICDESHRIKLASGKASRLAADLGTRVRRRGGRTLALTGTPMPHSPLDIWAQLRAIDGGQRLGTSYHAFCRSYGAPEEIYVPGGKQRVIFKQIRADRMSAFTSMVAPVMHQVASGDVLDLPETTDTYRTCTLSPKARRAYDALEKDLIAQVDGGTVTAANAMVLVLRLAQAAAGFGTDADTGQPIDLDPGAMSDKGQLLADVLHDLPAREPVVVFARFHHDLDTVAQVCRQQGRTYGELSGRRRDGLTDAGRMSPQVDVLGAQLKSGGVGIDLTRARHAIYLSLDFALADYLQSRARVHRPGQDRPVLYTHLLAENTIDRAVYGALAKREQVVDAVMHHINQGGKP